uniref:Zmp:0000000951 n=1 Tax=Scleropages formosus TaxID=113540 RepID=A0A8C9SEZ8_SCLFO
MATAKTLDTTDNNEGYTVAWRKLSENLLKQVRALWGTSAHVTELKAKLNAALELCNHFTLDVAVTGGTRETNLWLAKVLCGLEQEQSEGSLKGAEGSKHREKEGKGDATKVQQLKHKEKQVGEDKKEEKQDSGKTMRENEKSRATTAGNKTGDRENVKEGESQEQGETVDFGRSQGEDENSKGDNGRVMGELDSSITFLHSHISNVRFSVLQDVFIPSPQSQVGSEHQLTPSLDHYDALVVLTSEQNQEEHLKLAIEFQERNKLLLLVRAEPGWDLLQERSTGACKTCAWERVQNLWMELKQRRAAAGLDDLGRTLGSPDQLRFCLDDSGFGCKLLGLQEVCRLLTATLPELKRKVFCEFMMDFSKELKAPKLFRVHKTTVYSEALKKKKLCQKDLDQTLELCQCRELTDQPAKLLSILNVQENFQVDIGVLGKTACGISSLVNSLRGLNNQDEGTAPTESSTTTKLTMAYPCPALPNTRLWDFPGMPLASYPPRREPKASLPPYFHPPCDIYILVLPHSFGSESIQFLKHISSLRRPCLVVLSKADQLNEETTAIVREKSLEVLHRAGLDPHLFLVSTFHPDRWDFPKLKETLHDSMPTYRREAFARYMAEQLEERWIKNVDKCIIL